MRSESVQNDVAKARRQFLANCGRFAVATPPAISLLLAASRTNYAVASSGGGGGSSGGGNAPSLDTSSQGSIGGNTPMTDPPPTGGSGGSSPTFVSDSTISSTTNATGGQAAGRSCGNTFQALVNNDKCFR